MTACAALAAPTTRIAIIAAIKPRLFHPAVLAKMATRIEEISHGRFTINRVNAWYKPAFERAGIPFSEGERAPPGHHPPRCTAAGTPMANIDPKAVMFRAFAPLPKHTGGNGTTATGLVGSYGTVAARIRQFQDFGSDTFMRQFQPFEAEMRRFAHEVRPRVRRLSAAA